MDVVKLKTNVKNILSKEVDNDTFKYLSVLTKYDFETKETGMSRLIVHLKDISTGIENDELIESLTGLCDMVKYYYSGEYNVDKRITKIKTIEDHLMDFKANGNKSAKVTNLFIKDNKRTEGSNYTEFNAPDNYTIRGKFFALLGNGKTVVRR